MRYVLHILVMVDIYIVIVAATNLLVGMTNILSLCQAAFYGIGAYIGAYVLIAMNLPLEFGILVSGVAAGLVGYFLALLTLRLKADYFVLATLGFQLIVYSILQNWMSVTNGPYGISGINSPRLFGVFLVAGPSGFAVACTIAMIITVFVLYKLMYSPFGRVLRGIRSDEQSLLALGRNVTQFKVIAVVTSSSLIGMAGFLYAGYISYIDPSSFNLDESIFILSAVLIGGIGNLRGPVIGAVFVVVLPEILRFLGFPDVPAANIRNIIYGVVIVILMVVRPYGMAGDARLQ